MAMKVFLHFLGRTMAVLAIVATPSAWAICKINSSSFVAQDVMMDMGRVVILPDLAVGGVIKEIRVPITEKEVPVQCTEDGRTIYGEYVNAQQKVAVPLFANTYATDVEGVGIRVYRDSGSVQTYYPHTRSRDVPDKRFILAGGMFRVELIKTAEQTGSGPIAQIGRFTRYYLDGDGPSRPLLVSSFIGSGTTLVSATCQVQAGSSNVVVDFGSVSRTAFGGVGSRAVNRDFDIKLNCQGSNLAQFQSEVGIRLDATADISNLPGVLQLTGGVGSATGIGIELVQRDGVTERPLDFGQAVKVGKTQAGENTLILPLRARYIQTVAGTVGAGSAGGAATFTIEYQ